MRHLFFINGSFGRMKNEPQPPRGLVLGCRRGTAEKQTLAITGSGRGGQQGIILS